MPKLLLFVPCERVIVEQGSGVFSLISILQEITTTLVTTDAVPENAMAPNTWHILTVWLRDAADPSQRFEQRVRMENPNGNVVFDFRSDFEMTKDHHRTTGTIHAFPVGLSGQYWLRLSIRQAGQEAWPDVANYPITVVYAPPAGA